MQDAYPFLSAITLVASVVCMCSGMMFFVLYRNLKLRWPIFLCFGFIAYSISLIIARLTLNYAGYSRLNAISGCFAYTLIALGIWSLLRPNASQRGTYPRVVAIVLSLVAVLRLLGIVSLSSAQWVYCALWLSWAILFWTELSVVRAITGNRICAIICLIYPTTLLARQIHLFPVEVQFAPGGIGCGGLSVCILTNALLREWGRTLNISAELQKTNAELEQRVAQRTMDLQTTLRGLESFNRSVSHDLRGPLGNISNGTDLALSYLSKGKAQEADKMLRLVKSEANRLVSLVQELLLLAQLDRSEISRCRVDLNMIVHDVCEEVKRESNADHVQVMVCTLSEVHANTLLTRQVFKNLLSNAFKFTKDVDAPRVEVFQTDDTGQIVFHVRDNGVGFSSEDAKRILEPFVRVHAGYEGTGIGLSIVHRIVSKHGGWLMAVGHPGAGACFSFTLTPQPIEPSSVVAS